MLIRVWIFIAAVLLRLLLLPGRGFPDDINCFVSWMHALVDGGPRAIYLDASGIRYPAVDYSPAYLYVLMGVGWVERFLFGASPSVFIDHLFVKLPATIADFFLAFSVATIAERLAGPRAGTQALAVLLLSPLLWFVSAYWGQVDVIAGLGLVLCIGAALDERFLLMWVIAAVTITIKPQPFVVLPLLWIYQALRGRTRALLVLGPAASIVTAYVVALPAATSMRPDQTLIWLLHRYTVGVSKYPNGSSGAFNLYTLFGNAFEADSIKIAGLPIHTLGIFLTLSAIIGSSILLFLRLRMIKKETPQQHLFHESALSLIHMAGLALLGLFLFTTRMHERYEMSFIVLLPLISLLGQRQKIASIVLGVDFVINIAFVLIGFHGGQHHPQVRIAMHLVSFLNIVGFVMLIPFSWFTSRFHQPVVAERLE